MDLIQTPIETYSLKGIEVDVKRDDLVGDGDIFPRWSKIEGIRKILESDYIDKSKRKITYTFVPTKGKISSYISNNPNYILVKKANNKHSTIYRKKEICNTCDGSGFKNHKNCKEFHYELILKAICEGVSKKKR